MKNLMNYHTCDICGGRFDDEFPEWAIAKEDIIELDIKAGDRYHEECIKEKMDGYLSELHENCENYWEDVYDYDE